MIGRLLDEHAIGGVAEPVGLYRFDTGALQQREPVRAGLMREQHGEVCRRFVKAGWS